MQLPSSSAAYGRRVDYGTYVTRALRRGRHADLADGFDAVTEAVLVAGRAWDDARRATFAALADRDAADADLDRAAQEIRHALAGRHFGAEKELPYTQIFHKGLAWYVNAPLSEEVQRYRELVARLDKHLGADDPLHAQAVARLQAGIEAYATAVEALNAARQAQALAGSDVDVAEEALDTLAERTHGALTAKLGRSAARRYFPRVRRARGRTLDDGAPSAPDAESPAEPDAEPFG